MLATCAAGAAAAAARRGVDGRGDGRALRCSRGGTRCRRRHASPPAPTRWRAAAPAAQPSPTSGVTSRRGSARRSACGTCVRSGGGGRASRARVGVDQLDAGLTDEIGVTAQVAAHVDRRAELGESIGFERFDDLDVEVQLFGGRGHATGRRVHVRHADVRRSNAARRGAGAAVSSIESAASLERARLRGIRKFQAQGARVFLFAHPVLGGARHGHRGEQHVRVRA